MDIKELIKGNLKEIFKQEWGLALEDEKINLEHPKNSDWGDYATSVCLEVSNSLNQSSVDIAKKVAYRLHDLELSSNDGEDTVDIFEDISVDGPGFINFKLSSNFLLLTLKNKPFNLKEPYKITKESLYSSQNVLFEYTDPNPFKVFHIGHLMSNTIGESLSRIYEFLGANVKRANYQGDVGMHVAKSVWGMLKKLKEDNLTLDELSEKDLSTKARFLGDSYVIGAKAFENDRESKEQIQKLNLYIFIISQKRLMQEEGWEPVVDYKKLLEQEFSKDKEDKSKKNEESEQSDSSGSSKSDLDFPFDLEEVREIYINGRKWSLEAFEKVYDRLGTSFDKYYFESLVGEYGLNIVNDNLGTVFEKDQGAIIFRGENYGLHNRVFVNSFGLPTYEAKDLGLAVLKYDDFEYDRSFIITGNEINDYFKVVLKALGKIKSKLSKTTTHIGHGMLLGSDGKQMSSRKGKVITGTDLLDETTDFVLAKMKMSGTEIEEEYKDEVADQLAIGAIKYSILKQGFGRDIVFNKKALTEITGNTGPYLQYTHARASSVLSKVGKYEFDYDVLMYEFKNNTLKLENEEKEVLRHMQKFSDIIFESRKKLSPSIICDYLFKLGQLFNIFYNELPIIGAKTEYQKNLRLKITEDVKDYLKVGLWILGIDSPKKV